MTRVRRVDEAIVADIFVRFGHSAAWREDTTAYIPWRAEQECGTLLVAVRRIGRFGNAQALLVRVKLRHP